MFTAQHYTFLAGVLYRNTNQTERDNGLYHQLVYSLAKAFAQDNTGFKPDKWFIACHVPLPEPPKLPGLRQQ